MAYRIFQRRAAEAVNGVWIGVLVLHQPLHYAVTALCRSQVPAKHACSGLMLDALKPYLQVLSHEAMAAAPSPSNVWFPPNDGLRIG